jgi:hypothetical protein
MYGMTVATPVAQVLCNRCLNILGPEQPDGPAALVPVTPLLLIDTFALRRNDGA